MINSDTFIENLQKCRKLRSEKARLEKGRNRVIQKIIQLTERVAIREGEIVFSKNELVRLGTAIREMATGLVNNVVGFGVSVVRRNGRGMIANPTQLALTFSNALRREEEKIQRLRQQLRQEKVELRFKKEEQADLEARIDNVARQMTDNGCAV